MDFVKLSLYSHEESEPKSVTFKEEYYHMM